MLLLHVDDGNAAAASHTSHQQVVVVGGEDGATKRITAVHVAVHGRRQTVVQFQLIVDDVQLLIGPFRRVVAGDVDDAHGVVAPVRYGDVLTVVRAGNHLRQWAGLHHAHDAVVARVDDGHRAGVLRVDVERAAVIGHPQVSATM